MAWIEYHTALRDHWKIKRLASILEKDYVYALGVISCLWLWVAEYAPDGDINRFSDDEIRDASRCKLEKFSLQTLKNCELVNQKGFINDWNKHGLKLLKSNRKRVREWRKKKHYSNVSVMPTIPNQPNLTNQPNQLLEDYPKTELHKKIHILLNNKLLKTDLSKGKSGKLWGLIITMGPESAIRVLERCQDKQSFEYYYQSLWRQSQDDLKHTEVNKGTIGSILKEMAK